jgi:hypothetical protein
VRSAALILLLVACNAGDPSQCRIESYAAVDVKGQNATDCGAIGADGGAADMQKAHDCVLDAIANSRPFTLFYDVGDPIRHVSGGMTGSLQDGKLRLHAYAYVGNSNGGAGDSKPVVTVQSCTGIVAAAGCTPASGVPCLTCEGAGIGSTLCRF